ncbi:MAG TPA: hypothetical protein VG733_13855 [Chthoniobacteraceae bacterium]|nr:hypothetical protein [Chthoniobacteraceae bacterium]
MNPPDEPASPEPPNPQPASPPRPQYPPRPAAPPLTQDAGAGLLLDSLLKRPAQLIQLVCEGGNSRFWPLFLTTALMAFAVFGLVVGSFYGGQQYGISPAKICAGELFSLLICFPSFYIFASLSGVTVSLRALAGVFLCMFALTGLLLLGFAPVAWVFSQPTESVTFIGAMYLVFWLIATLFGLRLLDYMSASQNTVERVHLRVWALIFLLVCLQMTTALRPIVAKSDQWLPTEKKFFIAYWLENLAGALKQDQPPGGNQ